MTTHAAQRLQERIDKIWKHICDAKGIPDYEALIGAIRAAIRDEEIPPPTWIHKKAREMAHELYPSEEQDTIQPEQLYDLLSLIDNRDKAHAVLLELPESAVPHLDKLFDFILKEKLPAHRAEAQRLVEAFPYKRSGGPKTSSWPSTKVCREICEEIDRLHAKEDVAKIAAQEQMAQRHNLSLRMVQRIWKRRKEYLANNE